MPEWLDWNGGQAGTATPGTLVLRIAGAFVMGCVVAGVHHVTSGRRDTETDRSLPATLVLLSVLIALVTMVIGSDIARAFSLVGALAIVRFRTVVEDTRDTAFVIFAVAAGMAVGTGYFVGPLVCVPFVWLAAWFFRRGPGAASVTAEARLIVRLGAGRPPDGKLDALLREYAGAARLVSLATARGGSALDAVYVIPLPPADRVFALVADLSRLDGVQGVELKEE